MVVPTSSCLCLWDFSTQLSRVYLKSGAHILEALEIFTSSLKIILVANIIKIKLSHAFDHEMLKDT